MALLDPEVAKSWMTMTPRKMIVTTICAMIIFLGWYVKDEFKHYVQLQVQQYERSVSSFDPAKGMPTSLTPQAQEKVQGQMRKFLRTHDEVNALFMYEFVPRGQEILYQGRIIAAHMSQNGKDLVKRYNVGWLPMNSDREQVEKLLRGQPYYRPSTVADTLSADEQGTKYNMRLVEQDGTRFMLSVPISDATMQVRGYVTALISEYPSETQLKYYIGSLTHEAVELSQYFEG